MKDLKISTKLASAVLGKEVTKCSLINKARNSINITYFEDKEDFNTICREWNIYEFAFKCKEWAFKKNYTIVDGIDGIGEDICYIMNLSEYSLDSFYEQGVNYHNVFKACNWILEQNK